MQLKPTIYIKYSIAFIVLAAGFSLTWSLVRFDKARTFTVIIDNKLTLSAQQEIYEYIKRIHGTDPQAGHNAHVLLAKLKSIYPFIQRVRIKFKAPGHATVSVSAQRPFVIINSKQIITQAGVLALAHYYTPTSYQACCALQACPSEVTRENAQLISKFVRGLPAHIRQDFSCLWHNKTLIYMRNKLHDHGMPSLAILARADTVFSDRLLNGIDLLRALIRSRHRSKSYYSIDARFEDQLVLSHEKRGEGYEEGQRDT
jgi:hypothetical protein